MFVVVRAITYAALFISVVILYVPARLLAWSGIARPDEIHAPQVIGIALASVGGVVCLWCILTFIAVGRGTPAPFDPPRRLVMRGPYRFVRNPMYLSAGLALTGAAVFYGSWPLLGYAVLFWAATHLLVVWHEEPTLRRAFGPDYETYCRRVRRWWPRV